jgi:hypothetical protein
MKKILIASFVLLFLTTSFSQTTMASYRGGFGISIGHHNYKSTKDYLVNYPNQLPGTKSTALTIGLKGNYSNIAQLFDDESRFFFGDYIGADLGVALLNPNSKAKTTSFGLNLALDLGISAGFAISEDIEVGALVLFLHGYLLSDLDMSLGLRQGPIVIPSVKVKNAMLMFGYGKGVIGGTGFSLDNGKAIFIEPRFFNDDSDKFIFCRFERNWGSYPTDVFSGVTGVNEKGTVISVGFGSTF